jgi:hypothetical protein
MDDPRAIITATQRCRRGGSTEYVRAYVLPVRVKLTPLSPRSWAVACLHVFALRGHTHPPTRTQLHPHCRYGHSGQGHPPRSLTYHPLLALPLPCVCVPLPLGAKYFEALLLSSHSTAECSVQSSVRQNIALPTIPPCMHILDPASRANLFFLSMLLRLYSLMRCCPWSVVHALFV